MFDPSEVFNVLYRDHCLAGIQEFISVQRLSEDLVCAEIETRMRSMFSHLKNGGKTAASIRRLTLKKSSRYWQPSEFTASCFICLRMYSEHSMQCGHRICDVCISNPEFGTLAKGLEYHYDISICPFCQANIVFRAKLVPPTCRVRFLSMDGGGSRGGLSLGFLEAFQQAMSLPYPIQENFDYSIGTSSGKVIFNLYLKAELNFE